MFLLVPSRACPLLSSFAVTGRDLTLNKRALAPTTAAFAGSAFRFRSRHTIALESIAQIFFL